MMLLLFCGVGGGGYDAAVVGCVVDGVDVVIFVDGVVMCAVVVDDVFGIVVVVVGVAVAVAVVLAGVVIVVVVVTVGVRSVFVVSCCCCCCCCC